MYLPYCVHNYALTTWFNTSPFGSVRSVIVIRAHASMYDHISSGKVHASTSMHTHTFIRKVQSCASVNACAFSRNVHSSDSLSIHAHDSSSIFDFTSLCLLVPAHTSARICARASVSTCDYCGCFACMSIVLSNTLP